MIRFFVSSTFADMQQERDYIQHVIAPQVEKLANEHYETVAFEDLRWGIDTDNLSEEEHNGKVIQICLDEVVNCKPYLLVMMGGRYGSLMKTADIKEHAGSFEGYDFDDDGMVSLTELEILLGTELLSSFDKCIFCFHEKVTLLAEKADGELTEDEQRLKKLYGKILEAAPKHVVHFSNLEAFGEGVLQEIQEILQAEYQLPQYQSKVLKTLSDYEFFADKMSLRDYGGEAGVDMDELEALVQYGEHELVAIAGPGGVGKSFILNRLYHRFRDLPEYQKDYHCMIYFCGMESEAVNTKRILQSAIAYLESTLGYECSVSFEKQELLVDLKERFLQLLKEHKERFHKKLLVFVDALERLQTDVAFLYGWMPKETAEYVKVIYTCTEGKLPVYRKYHCVKVAEALEQSIIQERVEGYLKHISKSMPEKVKEAIVSKCMGKNELFLSLVLMRFDLMNVHDFNEMRKDEEKRSEYFLQTIDALSDSDEICMDIVDKTNELFQLEGMLHALRYLALSKYGLREKDFEILLEKHQIRWNAYEFARFRNFLADFFVEYVDGKIDFEHAIFRSCLLNMMKEEKKEYVEVLRNYLLSLPVERDVFRENFMMLAEQAGDFSGCGKYLLLLGREYAEITEVDNDVLVEEQCNPEWLYATRSLWIFSVTHYPSALSVVFKEIENELLEDKEKCCRYLISMLDLLLTTYQEERGLKRCFTDLKEYCKKVNSPYMQEMALMAEVALAYLPAMMGEFEKGADELKKLLPRCKEFYAQNASSVTAFQLYYLCKTRLGNAYFKLAYKKQGSKNEGAKQKAAKYFDACKSILGEVYEEAKGFYLKTRESSILVNQMGLVKRMFAMEQKLDLTNMMEEYMELAGPILNDKSAASLMPWMEMQVVYANRLLMSHGKAKQALKNLKINEQYLYKLLDLQEQESIYRLIFPYYQTYFRAAVLCVHVLGQDAWGDIYYALKKMLDFMEEYPNLYDAKMWNEEIKRIEITIPFLQTGNMQLAEQFIERWNRVKKSLIDNSGDTVKSILVG